MKRVFWFVLKCLLAVVALVVVLGIALVVVLRPPAPMSVPHQGAAIAGVTIINPGLDRHANQTIKVEGPVIKSVSDGAASDADSRYAGSFVIPGLIDMHVHNPPPQGGGADTAYFFLMYLRYGVTTIRDTGNSGFMFDMRSRLLNGEIAGPRAFTCGPILDGDPPVWPFSIVVRNAADADSAVDKLASQGADFVKAYERLTPDALHAIEAAAHRHNLPVIGHVPELVKFEDAHIDDVQHLTGAAEHPQKIYPDFPSFFVDNAKGWHDMDDARMAFIVQTSLQQHISHTPTIIVLDRTSRADYDAQRNEPIANLMPRWYPDVFWLRSGSGFTSEQLSQMESYGSAIPKIKILVRKLHEAGVPLRVGTDTINPFVIPGEALHEEMQNFMDSGFTSEQVLAATTRGNGAALPVANLGIIKTGAPADFLVLKEDPTNDISKLDSLQAVVTNGRLYTREDLDIAIARFRRRFSSPTYERTMMTLMRLVAPKPTTKTSSTGGS